MEMDNPPSKLTGNMAKCISIDWYRVAYTFMLYAAVNATRSPKEVPNWSGIKNDKSSKKITLAGYPSIDKKHL
jgi:hypothetical protein